MPNLLASLDCTNEIHLLIGYSNITNLRISTIIESNAFPILLIDSNTKLSPSVLHYAEENKLRIVLDHDIPESFSSRLRSLGRPEVDFIVDRVFVSLPLDQFDLKRKIFTECKQLRIPINTTDSPQFCTFTLLSTYTQGDFQFGVTTSGNGCKLASRIKREMVSKLPPNINEICSKIGQLRNRIQLEDQGEVEVGENDDDAINTNKFNSLIKEFHMTPEQIKLQRNRWLSQLVEYFPLNQLSSISIDDLTQIYKKDILKQDQHTVNRKGSISLVGSGPGSVSLLTLGALQAIHSADLILADKLVPQQVLDLIPKNHGAKLFIARKFPGNAEKAQEELLQMGIEGLNQGLNVLRLKQGDPYIFGRGGEEYNYFESHGFTPIVIPGISSALAAPVISKIPMTHRNVADQVLICTGTGRKGVVPNLPHFEKTRTTIFLMALHRILELIPVLIEELNWDKHLPCAIIERASCPDQRIVRTTLENVGLAVEACGSRPPGLLVTGYACEVIHKQSEEKWSIEEGFSFDTNLESILTLLPN